MHLVLAIKEEFDAASLAAGWEQLNGGRFALGGGAMAITASDGADVRGDVQGDVTAPFLARDVQGDFSVETAVTVDPQHSYQGAELLLYRDSETTYGWNAASAARVRSPSSTRPMDGTQKSTDLFRKGLTLFPRLPPLCGCGWCAGTSIKGFWHPANTTTWQELSGTAPLGGDAKAGVAALNRSKPLREIQPGNL